MIVILLVLFFSAASNSYANSYFDSYQSIGLAFTEVYEPFNEQGEAQNWDMIQAEDGRIYVGSSNGIIMWDGETWTQYEAPQSSRVRGLRLWKDGRIYVGLTNDVGFYEANDKGQLTYTSLLSNWTEKMRKFGSIWSVASTDYGVVFSSKKHMLYWDGKKVSIIEGAQSGKLGLFSIGDSIYYKNAGNASINKIVLSVKPTVEQLPFVLPSDASTSAMFINNDNKMTVVTRKHGIYEVSREKLNKRFDYIEMGAKIQIVSALQARDGYYYLLSKYQGLYIMNSQFELVKNYREKDGLGTNVMFDIKEDNQGNIWMLGEPNVVKLLPPHRVSYYKTESNSKVTERIKKIAGKIIVVGDSIHQLANQKNNLLAPAAFHHIVSSRKKVWDFVEFKKHVLYAGIGGVYASKITEDNQFLGYDKILDTPFAGELTKSLHNDYLLLTSDDGIFKIDFVDNNWQTSLLGFSDEYFSSIIIDENDKVWAGKGNGQLGYLTYSDDKSTLELIQMYDKDDGLGTYKVKPYILENKLVFATGNGLLDYQQNRSPQFQPVRNYPKVLTSKEDGVQLLYESEDKIWFKASEHVGYILKSDKKVHEQFLNLIPNGGYRTFLQSSTDILWVGMFNGLIYRINTRLLEYLPPLGHLLISKISNTANQEIIFGGFKENPLLSLTQQQTSIRIHFAFTDNSISHGTQYRYRLIGNSDEWSDWKSENYKDFTSLAGGDYRFEVEAKDGWGRVVQKSFAFNVIPPWYASQTAYIIYVILLALLFWLTSWVVHKVRTKKLQLKNLELQKLVTLKTAELTKQQQLKDRFFANVSHEFRTPLTLTIAPLESVLEENKGLSNTIAHPINTAIRNAKKMLLLVGQILDINRLESGHFPLRVSKYNISELVIIVVDRFSSWAQQNKQNMQLHNVSNPVILYYDADEMDKCLSNLLSNAIKYSGKGTTIEIKLVDDTNNNRVGISVSDNGKGISKEFEDKVFERYYQDKNSEYLTQPGTGIGLALVKELMELHKGQVEFKNRQGQGCEFVLWLKRGNEHFDSSQLIEPIAIKSNEIIAPISSQAENNSLSDKPEDLTTILVVDDNAELLDFISNKLAGYYKVIKACDGQEGLDSALTHLPDLIVSDVMMPKLNGYEMTNELKSNAITQSIPIILLSAKTHKREIVEGLQSGADDYLTKPFDTPELIARINGLLANRIKIRKSIQLELSMSSVTTPKSQNFADKITLLINEKLSDPDLNINYLVENLGLSRQTLHRKCKKEFSMSSIQLITHLRMQYAMKLLQDNQYSVSEIAYGTGFDSLAYFSKIFKKQFGKSPTIYKRTFHENT